MAALARTRSPVLTLPPGAAHPTPFGMSMFSHQPNPFNRPNPLGTHSWSRAPVLPPSSQRSGRKRSRDEAAVNLDFDQASFETIEPVKTPKDDWIQRDGLFLARTHSSQPVRGSGTSPDDKKAAQPARCIEEARVMNQQARHSMRNSKSQRLDLDAVSTSISNASFTLAATGSTTAHVNIAGKHLPHDASKQPVIDDFTLDLGIGWRRVSQEEHIQAAARGWARYIENHYPVTNARIHLESRGLESYLVETSEGYFLFSENLRQGRFVSKDLHQAFHNLKASPPTFEGTRLFATTQSTPPLQDVDMVMN